jgi:IPT/TIG domain
MKLISFLVSVDLSRDNMRSSQMFNRFKIRTVVAAFAVLVAAAVGCGGSGTSPTPSPAPLTRSPTVQPSLAPVITAVTPNAVSTGGGAWGTITGTGFQSGATVKFGGSAATYAYVDVSATIIRFGIGTEPHVAGPVDVVVTNPGGLADTATRGLEFKSPEAFDFNGTWTGHAGPEYETDMSFTVENNRLTSVSCGGSAPMQFSSSPSLANGEFSIVVSGGIEMSARIVSAASAVGTITLGPCAAGRWWGERAGSAREGQ